MFRKVEPELIYKLIKDEKITMFCATVLISITNAPERIRADAQGSVYLQQAPHQRLQQSKS